MMNKYDTHIYIYMYIQQMKNVRVTQAIYCIWK